MALLQIRLLGGFDCRAPSGETVTFPTRKVRALFGLLAVNAGQEQQRDKLAGLLWGDQPDAQARTNLRSALSRLRHALPAGAQRLIVAEAHGLMIEPDVLDVDTQLFRQQLADGTPESLEAAVALYRGCFLDGLEDCDEGFEAWLMAERQQYAECFLQALQQLLDHYVVTGGIDRAIQTALRLIHLDPLQESLQRTLIRLYIYQDRMGAALDQYHRCRELLMRELGIALSPETERLKAEILKKLPASHSASDVAPPVETDTVPERDDVVRAAAGFRARQRSVSTGYPLIVVLPFVGEAADGVQRHLAEGFAEDIATELGRFRELAVMAPVSAFAYRDARVAPERVGQELGTDFVLSGSLRASSDALRFTVRLIDSQSERQLWAERYDCAPEGIFGAQDELVYRIVNSLIGRIETARLEQAKRKRPAQWAAYDFWLHGWHRLKQPDLAAIHEARQFFERATKIDPDFPRPYIGLALAHLNEWACFAWNHWFFLKKEALDLARKAVQLDDHDNKAHCMLGLAELYAGDYAGAERHLLKALDLNPNDADVLAHAAGALALIGDHDTAVDVGRRALRLAPHYPEWYVVMVGNALFAAQQYQEAIETIATAPEANCNIPAVTAASYAYLGQPERGVQYKDTVYRHFRQMVARGAYPSDKTCVEWLLDLDPYQHPGDAEHYEQGLRKAGFE